MKKHARLLAHLVSLSLCASVASAGDAPVAGPRISDDGTVHIPAFDLPFSGIASPQMRDAFVAQSRLLEKIYAKAQQQQLSLRQVFDEDYYPRLIAAQQARYPVDIEVTSIGGVYAEVFTPREGVPAHHKNRVLINLHGGSFRLGGRTGGRVESIPIASVAKTKVISLDYRQFPEHRFPAASEDVATVYRELLKQYKPADIGIYGCSAGGYLTAQALAWFAKERLPTPGAIGVFGSAAGFGLEGHSSYLGPVMTGHDIPASGPAGTFSLEYLQGASLSDPLMNPWISDDVLRKFPPTLLINGLQDINWSHSVATDNKLSRLGVESNLHLWEGGGHCFLYNPEIPEARDAYDITARFFERHLGK
jgi:acetyl esterase/lipase